MDSLVLTAAELEQLTSYRQPAKQLAELHRQGFYRARRNRMGDVVLERAHYDAVCAAGRQAQVEQETRPTVRLLKRAA